MLGGLNRGVERGLGLIPCFFEELGAAGAVAVALVGDGIFLVVVLVVGFSGPEIGGGEDGDDDWFLEAVGLLEGLFGGFGLCALGVGVGEDSGAVLGAAVGELAA